MGRDRLREQGRAAVSKLERERVRYAHAHKWGISLSRTSYLIRPTIHNAEKAQARNEKEGQGDGSFAQLPLQGEQVALENHNIPSGDSQFNRS